MQSSRGVIFNVKWDLHAQNLGTQICNFKSATFVCYMCVWTCMSTTVWRSVYRNLILGSYTITVKLFVLRFKTIFVFCNIYFSLLTYLQYFNPSQQTTWHFLSRLSIFLRFNPILTGLAGTMYAYPPSTKIRYCPFSVLFRFWYIALLHELSVMNIKNITHLYRYQVCKNRTIVSRGHMTFCTRTSASNLPKIFIFHIYGSVQLLAFP